MATAPANGGGFFGGMEAAIDKLVAAANTGGGFTVTDEGGQALIDAIDTYIGKLDKHRQNADMLTRVLPLGSSPAANVFKPFLATIANDPVEGVIPAMESLRRRLEDAKAAIQKSMASYQLTEQQNSTNMKSHGIET